MTKTKKSKTEENVLKLFKGPRILLPIVLGLGTVGYMMFNEYNAEAMSLLDFSVYSVFWLFISVLLMVIRDLGYIVRLRILTSSELSWSQCFRVIMLWEFTSAVTPSAIGGTSVAVLYLHKENVSVGKSSAIVMATSFLDELYFILTFPFLLLFFNVNDLFTVVDSNGVEEFKSLFFSTALIGYSLKFLFTLVIAYGLFINPRGLKRLLKFIFRLKFLQRWKTEADKAGDDIVLASKELRKKNFFFWIKAFVASVFSWTSRYWVVNAMILAFFIVHDHFLLYARQLVMWIMMLVFPTPGGSGFVESFFSEFMGDFFPVAGLVTSFALLWRLITYYPYLIIGAFVFPRWLRKAFSTKEKT